MTDATLALDDSDFDDLPRTLRRERELRKREAREREAQQDRARGSRSFFDAFDEPPAYLSRTRPAPAVYGDDPVAASVQRFDVPFLQLSTFFLKAVLAAIPALLLLGVLLFFAGKGLQAYFPELVHTKILISFPNG